MVRPAQTARSERTRDALRQAAVVRFLAQGVEDTSAEQIAADAGCHCGRSTALQLQARSAVCRLHRAALVSRGPGCQTGDEPIIIRCSRHLLVPYDVDAVTKIAHCGKTSSTPPHRPAHSRGAGRLRRRHRTQLQRRSSGPTALWTGLRTNGAHGVTARCIAPRCSARWRCGWSRRPVLGELARLCHAALESLRAGLTDSWNTAEPSSSS